MSEIYATIADGFEKLAAGYRALAKEGTLEKPESKNNTVIEENFKEDIHEITIENVRAILAKKSQEGKTKEIKSLLNKYDAGKLSGVKPEDYGALLKEAEVL